MDFLVTEKAPRTIICVSSGPCTSKNLISLFFFSLLDPNILLTFVMINLYSIYMLLKVNYRVTVFTVFVKLFVANYSDKIFSYENEITKLIIYVHTRSQGGFEGFVRTPFEN